MNKTNISKELILVAAKELVTKEGVQGLNMRQVATMCKVSVGSVYNYFPNKNDLVIETVASVWMEIMRSYHGDIHTGSFLKGVRDLLEVIRKGSKKYPAFFSAHSMGFMEGDKDKGREMMTRYFGHIRASLLDRLKKDKNIKKEVFDSEFTEEEFVDFIFGNILTSLSKDQAKDEYLLKVIEKMIY